MLLITISKGHVMKTKAMTRTLPATAVALGMFAAGLGYASGYEQMAQPEPTSATDTQITASCDVSNFRSARSWGTCNWAAGWSGIIVDGVYLNSPGGKASGPVMAS